MAVPGVTSIKTFTYRGNAEEWSNQYHFLGSPPSDDAGWITLMNALASYEAAGLTDLVTIVRMYGYDDLTASHPTAAFTYDMVAASATVTGIVSSSGHVVAPGDAAAWVRWSTDYFNSKGKRVYLRKYIHSVLLAGETADNYDDLLAAHSSGLASYGSDLLATVGGWPGLADPHGNPVTSPVVSPFVTTRTLKRRGRRP